MSRNYLGEVEEKSLTQGKYQGEVDIRMPHADPLFRKDSLSQAPAALAVPSGVASATDRCFAQGHVLAGQLWWAFSVSEHLAQLAEAAWLASQLDFCLFPILLPPLPSMGVDLEHSLINILNTKLYPSLLPEEPKLHYNMKRLWWVKFQQAFRMAFRMAVDWVGDRDGQRLKGR